MTPETNADRTPGAPLQIFYEACRRGPSDINEHLPLLRELASKCEHVTEFGMRWANGSTAAFLAAQPAELISWDLDPAHVTSQRVQDLVRNSGRTRFQPRAGDTLKITIERTDLLFIDTYHTGRQLLSELERHADPREQTVRKYIVCHDTATFGLVGEDGVAPGLRAAIRQFQRLYAFPLWLLIHDLDNNNGLVVLEHVCADGHGPLVSSGTCTRCGQIPLKG